MASNIINFACYCYLIVLAVCVDDIEQEIEDFYDEYPDREVLYEEIDEYYREHPGDDGVTEPTKSNELKHGSNFSPLNATSNSTKEQKGSAPNRAIKNDSFEFLPLVKHKSGISDHEASDKKYNWPKFDEILLSIGKRYDWKNDRWVKVKEKIKTDDQILNDVNSKVSFLSKHRFIYRMIKLNRSKSKRNIVVAVKAVR